MDLSKEYILMCERAGFVPAKERGSLYYIKIEQSVSGEIKVEEQYEYYDCDGFQYGESYKNGLCWHKDEGNTTEYYQDKYGGRRTKKIIWLPRQDQLQEMVCEGEVIPCFALYHWITNSEFNYDLHKTEEQRWLAYVMNEKYNKTWNGKDWEKHKKRGT